jgi:hypothetical protein
MGATETCTVSSGVCIARPYPCARAVVVLKSSTMGKTSVARVFRHGLVSIFNS